MNTFLSQLDWRFATKNFDASKPITDDTLAKIERAIQMAPSAFGIQPYHVVIVTNQSLREKLKDASYSQPQVAEASALLVFCARTDINDRIDSDLEIAI